jgi:hypothetical protein
MVIYDYNKLKSIEQIFLLIAFIVYFTVALILKYKKIEITYKIVLKMFLLILFPIISFPFLFLSPMSPKDKIIGTVIVLSVCLIQFYGTIAFRKMMRKLSSPSDKV